jgi:hypothetical protein
VAPAFSALVSWPLAAAATTSRSDTTPTGRGALTVRDRDGVHVMLGHDPGDFADRRVAGATQDAVMHDVPDVNVIQ